MMCSSSPRSCLQNLHCGVCFMLNFQHFSSVIKPLFRAFHRILLDVSGMLLFLMKWYVALLSMNLMDIILPCSDFSACSIVLMLFRSFMVLLGLDVRIPSDAM